MNKSLSFTSGTKSVEEIMEEVKFDHLEWLLQTGFPHNSKESSETLATYMADTFNSTYVVEGTFAGKEHTWLEVEGKKIDFTFFQYLLNNFNVNYNLDVLNIYSLCILGIQGGYMVQGRFDRMYEEIARTKTTGKGLETLSYLEFLGEPFHERGVR
jgi:hypothetical protein